MIDLTRVDGVTVREPQVTNWLCPYCEQPVSDSRHEYECAANLRAQLAAAEARAERAERSRDKLRERCGKFYEAWQDTLNTLWKERERRQTSTHVGRGLSEPI